MAYEIASKIGEPLIASDYYSDYTWGFTYEFDSLKISYHDEERSVTTINIMVGGRIVLHYVYDTDKFATLIDGKWIELIETIYSELNMLEFEKKYEEEKYREKELELRRFEEYLKVFINSCRYSNALEWYNEKLGIYGIKILKKTKYISTGSINPSTGSFEESPRDYYEIYYHDEKVLTFNDDVYLLYRFCGDYVNEYKPGYWITLFKEALEKYKLYKDNETRRIADESAAATLKRFRDSRK